MKENGKRGHRKSAMPTLPMKKNRVKANVGENPKTERVESGLSFRR